MAEPNHGAREHYERRNFAYCYDTDGNLVRSRHKVYDVNHITMHAQPADVRASLVHHGFDAASGTLAESAAAAFRPVMSPPTP